MHLATSLQPTSLLSPLLTPPHHHKSEVATLIVHLCHSTIILAHTTLVVQLFCKGCSSPSHSHVHISSFIKTLHARIKRKLINACTPSIHIEPLPPFLHVSLLHIGKSAHYCACSYTNHTVKFARGHCTANLAVVHS